MSTESAHKMLKTLMVIRSSHTKNELTYHMNVVFRVDASRQIGTGHVMRCTTLADVLVSRGVDVSFICRAHEGNLIAWLRQEKKYPVYELSQPLVESLPVCSPPHAHWLAASQEDDALATIHFCQQVGAIDFLVVDHYAIDFIWEQKLRVYADKIFVIDDLADRRHDTDFLLDQSYVKDSVSRYQNLIPKACQSLLGPRYALLRPEFAKTRALLKRDYQRVKNVLVFFGGSDVSGMTLRLVRILKKQKDQDIKFNIILGPVNEQRNEIQNSTLNDSRFLCHDRIGNVAEKMAEADLFIGAGGTITWERAYLGLTGLVVSVAENQIPATEYLNQENCHYWLGSEKEFDENIFLKKFSELCADSSTRLAMSEKLMGLVDGLGVARVADFFK